MRKIVRPGDAWLDLGGGRDIFPENPSLARELGVRCRRLVGIDPSPNVLENEFVSERFQGFIQDFNRERNFDIVSLRMVAEHVSDPHLLAEEISQSLVQNGILVILTVWNAAPITWISKLTPHSLHYPIKKIFWGGEEKDTFPTLYKMNTRKKLRSIFENVGLETLALRLIADCSTTGKLGILNWGELSLWKSLNALHIVYPESCILAVFRKR